MRNFSIVCKLAAVALFAFGTQGCKKRLNGIDNNQILSKPYSLFIADSSGTIEYTNDGDTYNTVFAVSGSQVRAMAYSGEYLVKVLGTDAFVARHKELKGGDNYNFNPIGIAVNPIPQWQSMIQNVPDHDNRIYLAGNAGKGVIYSDSNGKRNTWKVDNNFAPSITGTPAITSFTYLVDGTLVGFDHTNTRLFHKNGIHSQWVEQAPLNGLPTGGKFFLSHINNTIVLGDSSGVNGVWFSNDKGVTWAQCTGIPAGAQITCMLAPFDRLLLAGTAHHGMFLLPLNSSNFQSSNNGLNQGVTIRAIAAKDDYYKNNAVFEYVYLATDFGLYRSMDVGRNWILIRRGNYTAAY